MISAANDNTKERDRFLLLDSRIIEEENNVELTVGAAHKDRNNPLFREDKPWEPRFDNPYCSVIYDQEEEIYKCWYSIFTRSDSKGDLPGEGIPSEKRAWADWIEGNRQIRRVLRHFPKRDYIGINPTWA